MPQIADTGFLVAYWSRADAHHQWARTVTVRAPLRTCDAVLTEAAYLLGQAEPLLRMLSDGDLVSDFNVAEHVPELLRWLRKYADLDPGLTDACVVRLSEIHPRFEILTTDRRDFTLYRTLSGKTLKCQFPT
jgi:predicted nucleic acid-binding protein